VCLVFLIVFGLITSYLYFKVRQIEGQERLNDILTDIGGGSFTLKVKLWIKGAVLGILLFLSGFATLYFFICTYSSCSVKQSEVKQEKNVLPN